MRPTITRDIDRRRKSGTAKFPKEWRGKRVRCAEHGVFAKISADGAAVTHGSVHHLMVYLRFEETKT